MPPRDPTPRPHIRPWALAAPILILLIALPLLRPLRHPLEISRQEASLLASVQGRVEHQHLWLTTPEPKQDPLPVFALLLCGPYWVMRQTGLALHQTNALVSYLLTLIGVTIPVAASAGL